MTKRTKKQLEDYIEAVRHSLKNDLEKLKELKTVEKKRLKIQYPLEMIYKKQRTLAQLEKELKEWKD